MPWLTIIMTVLSFLLSKKAGASDTTALLTAGLVGGATYHTTHETEWGQTNLGQFDGVVESGTTGEGTQPTKVVGTSGTEYTEASTKPAVQVGGETVNTSGDGSAASGGTLSSIWKALKSSEAVGGLAAATVAVAASSVLSNPIVLAVGGFLLVRWLSGSGSNPVIIKQQGA